MEDNKNVKLNDEQMAQVSGGMLAALRDQDQGGGGGAGAGGGPGAAMSGTGEGISESNGRSGDR